MHSGRDRDYHKNMKTTYKTTSVVLYSQGIIAHQTVVY